MGEDTFVVGSCLLALAFGVWVACKHVLGPTATLLLVTVQKLSEEGRLVALASVDFLKGVVWPLTILVCAIVVLPYLVKAAMALWCLQSWKDQQRNLQDRIADEVKNVGQTCDKMSQEYQSQIRHLEDQKQKHITEKTSEVRRIREKYEASRRSIEEECNVSRVQQQLVANPEMTVLQAFNLGVEYGTLAGTKDQRLAREDECLKEEIKCAEEVCKNQDENTDSTFQRFEDDQLQQRAKFMERLSVLQGEGKQLRAQLPGHFRSIVGESARLCDQSMQAVQDAQRALTGVKQKSQ